MVRVPWMKSHTRWGARGKQTLWFLGAEYFLILDHLRHMETWSPGISISPPWTRRGCRGLNTTRPATADGRQHGSSKQNLFESNKWSSQIRDLLLECFVSKGIISNPILFSSICQIWECQASVEANKTSRNTNDISHLWASKAAASTALPPRSAALGFALAARFTPVGNHPPFDFTAAPCGCLGHAWGSGRFVLT